MDNTRCIVLSGKLGENSSNLTIVRGPMTFIISFSHAHIQNTRFGTAYLAARKTPISDATYKDPIDLIKAQCLPLMQRLAPQTTIVGLTIEQLCRSPTYRVELVGREGENEAHAALHEMVDYTPSYDIVPMPTKELPKICKDIPHIHASNLTIAPTSEDWYVQGAVNLSNSGDSIAYLKPRSIERAFEREISILAQIKASGLPSPGVRVPGLLGIVVTGEEGEEVVGMLITLVPSSSSENNHLLSPASWSLTSLHTKWENQVRRTVQALHQHGIIWGDVNPCNVVIDKNMDAWVIDFGGLNNPEFVDDELMETREGDWQGVGRLFGKWLPERVGKEDGTARVDGQDMKGDCSTK